MEFRRTYICELLELIFDYRLKSPELGRVIAQRYDNKEMTFDEVCSILQVKVKDFESILTLPVNSEDIDSDIISLMNQILIFRKLLDYGYEIGMERVSMYSKFDRLCFDYGVALYTMKRYGDFRRFVSCLLRLGNTRPIYADPFKEVRSLMHVASKKEARWIKEILHRNAVVQYYTPPICSKEAHYCYLYDVYGLEIPDFDNYTGTRVSVGHYDYLEDYIDGRWYCDARRN